MVQLEKFGAPSTIGAKFSVGSIIGLSDNRFLQASDPEDQRGSPPGKDIEVSFFSLRGEQIGQGRQVNTETWHDQAGIQFTALSGGKLIATWIDTSSVSYKAEVRSQILTADGVKDGPEVRISEASSSPPSITTLKNGSSVISWVAYEISPQDPGQYVTVAKARILDSEGSPVGPEFQVNTSASLAPDSPNTRLTSDVVALAGGGFVVSWSSFSVAGKTAVRSQAYSAEGEKLGVEVRVDVVNTFNRGSKPAVAGLANGNYVVTWADADEGVKARIFTAGGTKASSEIAVDAKEVGHDPAVIALTDGTFVIGWTGKGGGVFGRTFDAGGAAATPQFELNSTPLSNKLTTYDVGLSALPNGGFVATWHNAEPATEDESSRILSTGVQFFLPSNLILETEGKTVAKSVAQFEAYDYIVTFNNPTDTKDTVSLRLVGGGSLDLVDELEGLRGATIYASDKGNTITTGAGNDTLVGGAAKDILRGGDGDDRYYVDDVEDVVHDTNGSDTVFTSVSYNLSTLARGERIEFLRASDSKSTAAIDLTGNSLGQTIVGNRGVNKISAGGGDDTLYGGRGHDVLTGGGGKDKFVFDTDLGKGNVDSLMDFSHADDTVVLGSSTFKGMDTGQLEGFRFKQISSGSSVKGVDQSDRVLYDKAHGDIYYDRDGSGSEYGRVKFAEVADNKSLESNDFLII